MKEKVITKEKKVKKEKVEFFTDEMHKGIFAFQEGYKSPKGGKAVMATIKFKTK